MDLHSSELPVWPKNAEHTWTAVRQLLQLIDNLVEVLLRGRRSQIHPEDIQGTRPYTRYSNQGAARSRLQGGKVGEKSGLLFAAIRQPRGSSPATLSFYPHWFPVVCGFGPLACSTCHSVRLPEI